MPCSCKIELSTKLHLKKFPAREGGIIRVRTSSNEDLWIKDETRDASDKLTRAKSFRDEAMGGGRGQEGQDGVDDQGGSAREFWFC